MGRRYLDREPRHKIGRRVRVRTDAGWFDARLGNASSRGIMLDGIPLERCSYVEVRRRGVSIVGRVVWARGQRCGVRTQDQVDIPGLLDVGTASGAAPSDGTERRSRPRMENARQPTPEERADANRRWGRRLEFTVLAIVLACGAMLIGESVRTVLATPFDAVGETMRMAVAQAR